MPKERFEYVILRQYVLYFIRWVGFIKDYDGGTLMECYIHPNINYLKIKETISKQRQFIMDRIYANSL